MSTDPDDALVPAPAALHGDWMHRIEDLLAIQAGVIARSQVLDRGVSVPTIKRWLRRKELAVVHPGVYVAHTGPLTWHQRAWAGVLHAAPAVLAGPSALRAADGPGRAGSEEELIHVAVDRSRRVVAPAGVKVVRTFDLQGRALWNTSPPRLRYEEAALDAAIDAVDDFAMVAALARAVQRRRTTAARMSSALAGRQRAPNRALAEAVLDDIAHGTCSVLEHAYLLRVERAHALPTAQRQLLGLSTQGVVYRDTAYGDLIVELDGRLFHDSATQRDSDFERDLDAALDGQQTIRLSWGQVVGRPCSTASKVSRLLVARGWAPAQPCGLGCAVQDPA